MFGRSRKDYFLSPLRSDQGVSTIVLPNPTSPNDFSYVLPAGPKLEIMCIYLEYHAKDGPGKAQMAVKILRENAPIAAGQSSDYLPANNISHLFWIPEMQPSSTPSGLVNIYAFPQILVLHPKDSILFVGSRLQPRDRIKNIFITFRSLEHN